MSTSIEPTTGAARPHLVVSDSPRRRWARRIDDVLFVLWLMFALALPFSEKGTQHVWHAVFFLWVVKLVVERRRPFSLPRALAFPMLVFMVLSGISSAVSPFPMASWDRMKIVCLMLVAVLFAETIKSVSHLKWVISLLLFSVAVSAGITGWQYFGGFGVEITNISLGTPLAAAGVQSGDVLQSIDGRGVHSPSAMQQLLQRYPADAPLRVRVAHSTPVQRLDVVLTRNSFAASGLLMPNAPLRRGHPLRPQGYFSHYAIYAEVMLQVGLLAWGLLLATRRRRGAARWLLGLVFLLTAAVVTATQTRSAMGAMLIAGFLLVIMAAGRKERILAVGALVIALALSTVWIRHTRGVGWVGQHDPGTEFRVMMWQDALRLIPQHPWFGIGMQTVQELWRQFDIRAYRLYPVRWHFHSTYLQVAVERGLPALAAWLWLAVAYLRSLFKLLPRARASGWLPHGIVLGILGGFLAFLVCGIVQYNLGEEQISVTIWFLMGLALALHRVLPGAAPESSQV